MARGRVGCRGAGAGLPVIQVNGSGESRTVPCNMANQPESDLSDSCPMFPRVCWMFIKKFTVQANYDVQKQQQTEEDNVSDTPVT